MGKMFSKNQFINSSAGLNIRKLTVHILKLFLFQCIGLKEIPEDDFYCKDCKREDTTIKPGN